MEILFAALTASILGAGLGYWWGFRLTRPQGKPLRPHSADAGREEQDISSRIAVLMEIVENFAQGVMVLDQKGVVVLVNAAALNILRVPGEPGEWKGRSSIELLRDKKVNDGLNRVLSGEANEVHLNTVRDDLHLEVIIRPVQMNSSTNTPGYRQTIVVLNDMTRLVKSKQAGRDLVANVAHQLRTPLTAIKGYAETLLEVGDRPEYSDSFLRIIVRNADRLAALVEDVLTLFGIEESDHLFSPKPVELGRIIRQAVEDVAVLAEERSVGLVLDLSSAPVMVAGRPRELEQAVLNLIDNAVKYTGERTEVRIRLTVNPNEAVLAVKDSGPGISGEARARIFERFFRIGSEHERDIAGTGLGLAIVKEVAESHRGRVWLDSRYGRGSTFYLALPLYENAEKHTGMHKPES